MSRSIVEEVFSRSRKQPDKLCLVDAEEAVSYRDYAERIARAADALSTLNLKRGDCVLVESTQMIDYLAIEMALHLLGVVFVPAENHCSQEKLRTIVARVRAAMILSIDPLDDSVGVPHLTHGEFAAMMKDRTAGSDFPYSFPDGEAVSEILFSSGTTGTEKAIVMTHRSSIALAENVIDGLGMTPDTVELITLPMNHSHGLRRYYANMVCGSTAVILKGVMNLKLLYELMDRYRINGMDIAPTALSILLKRSGDEFAKRSGQMRYIQLGTEPVRELDKEVLCRLLPKSRLYNFYGCTESGCTIIYNFNDGKNKTSCIGKPTGNVELRLIDADGVLREPRIGQTGLIATRGRMNMTAYLDAPEETAKTLRDGFIYTKDEAYIDEDGDVILMGRQSNIIIVAGIKVPPEEIEDAVRGMPGIADCACIGVADEIKGQVPVLFVQLESGAAFDPVAIREWLRTSLEPQKMPARIKQIDSIPRSFNGKLLRRELHE